MEIKYRIAHWWKLAARPCGPRELERALLDREIDIAVHSMKDVETVRAEAFRIAAMLPRADVRDRLIGADSIAALPQGAKVGTSSPRRGAAESSPSRYRHRQHQGQCGDAIIQSCERRISGNLARWRRKGLARLGQGKSPETLHSLTSEMLPAASQGAIGIDCLVERTEIAALMVPINDLPTFTSVMAERAFLEALGGT